MSICCGCNYDSKSEVTELCEGHFEVRRLNAMMDDMWTILTDRNKTFSYRISETMSILRDK